MEKFRTLVKKSPPPRGTNWGNFKATRSSVRLPLAISSVIFKIKHRLLCSGVMNYNNRKRKNCLCARSSDYNTFLTRESISWLNMLIWLSPSICNQIYSKDGTHSLGIWWVIHVEWDRTRIPITVPIPPNFPSAWITYSILKRGGGDRRKGGNKKFKEGGIKNSSMQSLEIFDV